MAGKSTALLPVLAIGGAAIAAALAFTMLARDQPPSLPAPSPVPVKPFSAVRPPAPSASPTATAVGSRGATAGSPSRGTWAAFRERFGGGLEARFGRDGALEEIRGTPGSGQRAGKGFDPTDTGRVLSRAREVVAGARDLIGVQAGAPLGNPQARTGEVSAQVSFRQSSDGVPVAPQGTVTVDLGPQGELLGLSSSYVRGLSVVNDRVLDAETCRSKAIAAIVDQGSSIRPSGGSPVVWVPFGSSRGRHAYEYFVQGRQVIVDASSGEVLYRRDQRDF